MSFKLSSCNIYSLPLSQLPSGKLSINTINAYSYNLAQSDTLFSMALEKSDVLLPDGISIVVAQRFLTGDKLKKIAGADLFYYEMSRLHQTGGSCFFLGSNESTLKKICDRAASEYPNVIVNKYSPPYKAVFLPEDNAKMLNIVNDCKPDVLFIGMTAPKQEKWAYQNLDNLNVGHICSIGAVFDFYSMQIKRAPDLFIKFGLEWFYRFIKEPKRLWRRYLLGNVIFIFSILKEKFLLL